MTDTPSSGVRLANARALLGSFKSRILVFCEAALPEAIERTRKQLFTLADKSDSYTRAAHWMSGYLQMGHQAGPLKLACIQALPSVLDAAIDAVVADKVGVVATKGANLTLVDLKETERAVVFDRAARAFNTEYDDILAPLTHRISILLGHEEPKLSQNPFRPEIFMRAFFRGWELAKLDDAAAEDVVLGLDPLNFLPLDTLYEGLNDALIKAGIAPNLEYQVRKSRDANRAEREALRQLLTGEAAREAAPNAAPVVASIAPPASADQTELPAVKPSAVLTGQELRRSARDSLEQLILFGQQLNQQAAAPDGFVHTQPLPSPVLLDWLATLQARTLAMPLREEGPPQRVLQALSMRDEMRNAPPLDRSTVDALAAVFDFMFEESTIPNRLKHVLSKLQVPVLKAAIINRGFFAEDDHPARQLLDMLAGASVGWRPENGTRDPLYVQIDKTVQRVLVEFHDKPELFSALIDDFERFLFEMERDVVHNVAPYTAEVATNERLDLALRACDECIHEHLKTREPAPLLVPFILREWRLVLAHAWGSRKTQRDIWDRAVATMDGLIWSVEPKRSTEERRKLVVVLPRLVSSLNSAMDAIGWAGEPRATFTRRLIEIHSESVQVKGHTPADPKRLAREKQEARVAWQELQARRAELFLREEDRFDIQAHQLASGAWFDFIAQDGAQNRYRLSMVSPMRTRYVFTLNDGQQAFVRNEREVAKSLRDGYLKLLSSQPIVGRAINEILVDDAEELDADGAFEQLQLRGQSAA